MPCKTPLGKEVREGILNYPFPVIFRLTRKRRIMESVFSKPEALELFRQHATIKKYPAGITLISQGDEIHELLLIESGLVKLTHLEANGNESLVAWCKKGSILGVAGVMSLTGAIVTSTTINECEIHCLAIKKFRRIEQDNPILGQAIGQVISQQYNDLVIHLSQLTNIPARIRLIQTLLNFIVESNAVKSDKISVHFPFSNKDLAAYLAITPEHLSRLYNELTKDGFIHHSRGVTVVPDLKKLQQEAQFHRKGGAENLAEFKLY